MNAVSKKVEKNLKKWKKVEKKLKKMGKKG